MKIIYYFLQFAVISLFTSVSVSAGGITDTYTTGDTLTANKMTSIKNAVNDNNTRINTLENNSANTLSGLSCNNGEVAKFNGTSWVCAVDIDTNAGGDITSVTAGTGLAGGGVSGDTSLSVNPVVVQTRVTGGCVAGQSIRAINENGTVTCEVDTDTDTTYSAGSGISLSGTTLSTSAGNVVSVSSASAIVDDGVTLVNLGSSPCPSTGFNYTGAYQRSTTSAMLGRAPIQLPHNATVTKFTMIACDNDPAQFVNARLIRSDDKQMATASTTNADASVTLFRISTTTIQTPVIDNLNYSYFLLLSLSGYPSAIPLSMPISMVVEYTLP